MVRPVARRSYTHCTRGAFVLRLSCVSFAFVFRFLCICLAFALRPRRIRRTYGRRRRCVERASDPWRARAQDLGFPRECPVSGSTFVMIV